MEQCLNSLWMQTVHNHKVIIVDDGSKDKYTSQICKSYAQKHPEMFTYIYQENKGLGAARNTGLKLVDTEYVGFLDSDDWLVGCDKRTGEVPGRPTRSYFYIANYI